jgi:hypothetical protein
MESERMAGSMRYEVRNQMGNVPHVPGLNEEIVAAHEKEIMTVQWDGEDVTILGHRAKDGVTVIRVHITGIEDGRA